MTKKKVILDPINCAVCGKEFTPADKRRRACSRSCGGKLGNTSEAREKMKQTKLEKYGDPNFNNREKVRKTIQEKYGEQYVNTSQVPEIKQKIIDTYTKNNGGMGMASKSVSKKVLQSTKDKLGIEDDSITNVGQIETIKDKIRETTEGRWGGIGFASEKLSKKSQETFKELYGEDLYESSYKALLVAKALMERYGVITPYEIPEFQEKARKTTIERHGGLGGNVKSVQDKYKERLSKFKELYESGDFNLSQIGDIMKVSQSRMREWAKELGIILPRRNKLNETWQLFLEKETGVIFKFEGAIYGDSYKKADLYNEEFKLAIEINPTITHTTQPSPFHGKKVSVKYHQERAILAEQNGWHLIQVFDWDNPDDIISLVKSICNINQERIFARKCVVKEIPLNQAKEFVKNNHRHGSSASGKISYGLFYDDKLIQVASFSKERFVKDEGNSHYELIRMCSLQGVKVIGGASKLFNAFVNSEYQPQKIKTFADYSKSQGKVYENIGMNFIGLANLNGLYANIDTGEAYKVTACTAKFKKEYEKLGLTQQQYMNSKRFYRINDAGNKIFEWVRN